MNLRWVFSPHYINFPILVVFILCPSWNKGEGGRCGEDDVTYWPSSCSWFFLWQVMSAGPQLSAGLEGCK